MPRLAQQLVMFACAMVGWVFFRALSFGEALHILRVMVVPTDGSWFSDINVSLVLAVMSVAAWWSMRGPNAFDMQHEWTPRRKLGLAAAFGAGLALIVTARPSPFLYFQF
jgi:hypothetical protein